MHAGGQRRYICVNRVLTLHENGTPHAGGFIVALKDTSGSGKADITERFWPSAAEGGRGGTGIALYKGAVSSYRPLPPMCGP
jgi:hypothetical protein